MTLFLEILGLAVAAIVLEDVATIGAGLAVASGKLNWYTAVVGTFLGVLAGDFVYFFGGRYMGRWALHRPPFKWFVHKDQLAWCKLWVYRSRALSIVSSRFVPSLRSAVPFTVGISDVPLHAALPYFVLAASLYSTLIVSGAMYFGVQLSDLAEWGKAYGLVVVFSLLACAYVLVQWISARRKRKERHATPEPNGDDPRSRPLETSWEGPGGNG